MGETWVLTSWSLTQVRSTFPSPKSHDYLEFLFTYGQYYPPSFDRGYGVAVICGEL